MDRRSWTSQIVDLVDFDIERERHIVAYQFKSLTVEQMLDVAARAAEEIIDANYIRSPPQRRRSQRCEPRNPDPPVTNIRCSRCITEPCRYCPQRNFECLAKPYDAVQSQYCADGRFLAKICIHFSLASSRQALALQVHSGVHFRGRLNRHHSERRCSCPRLPFVPAILFEATGFSGPESGTVGAVTPGASRSRGKACNAACVK